MRADGGCRSRSRRVWSAAALLLLLIPLLLAAAPATAQGPNDEATQRALAWLRTQQLPNGGFTAFGADADPGATADAVMALVAAGNSPTLTRLDIGTTPLVYLSDATNTYIDNPGVTGKVALAVIAAGLNPRDIGGRDLLAAIAAGLANGRYGQSFYGNLYAVLALRAAGVAPDPAAASAILDAQLADGSWNFNGDPAQSAGDSNTTALAIQTLVALGIGSDAVAAGLAYINTLQDPSGAVAYDGSTLASGGDANSTALAIQAYVAASRDPAAAPGGSLATALQAFQKENGAFLYTPAYPDDSLLATVQAIPALALKPLPLTPLVVGDPLAAAVQPAAPQSGCDYQDTVQHNLCGIFRDMWVSGGGLATFGYALSEAFNDATGMRVQYFERARFEWRPENAGTPYEVLLTRVGAESTAQRFGVENTAPAEPLAGCAYVSETGHNVCGPLADFWTTYGGLPIFGYPLSEPVQENGVTVQYFERARFEYAPGVWPERGDVLLGRLGAELLDRELAR